MTVAVEGIDAKVTEICANYPGNGSSLIEVLHDISSEYNYLPADAIRRTSENLGVPLSKVYAVATFYKGFSLEPKGKNIIRVCKGTACHVRGADRNIEEIERLLGIGPGETTEDLKYTLEVVNCVGTCAMAPVVVVDDDYYANASPITIQEIVSGRPSAQGDEGGDD